MLQVHLEVGRRGKGELDNLKTAIPIPRYLEVLCVGPLTGDRHHETVLHLTCIPAEGPLSTQVSSTKLSDMV